MFSFLLTWYNLPFLIALGGCILFALLQVIGGIGDNNTDSDFDADIDADADLDLDADADLDIDASANLPEDSGGHTGPVSGLLAMLGVRHMPLALVLMALLGCFGAVGLIANTLLVQTIGSYAPLIFPVVLLAAGLLAVVLTGRISRLLGRAVAETTAAVGFEQLIGRVGTVTSAGLSSSYGRVSVRDNYGTVHTVYAVIEQGESLPEHSEVALVAYDNAQRRFLVRPIK